MSGFIGQEITRIRNLVGPTGRVFGQVSGGVDSTVAVSGICSFLMKAKLIN